jgi:hypothetical protein
MTRLKDYLNKSEWTSMDTIAAMVFMWAVIIVLVMLIHLVA